MATRTDRYAGALKALHRDQSALLGAGLLMVAGAAYWVGERLLPTVLREHPDLYVYFGRPLLWLAVGLLAVGLWRRLSDTPPFDRRLTQIAAFVGLFHVSVLVIAGFVQGFASSAVSGRLGAYPGDVFRLVAMVAGLEVARAAFFWSWRGISYRVSFGVTVFALFVLSVPMGQFGGLQDSGRVLLVGGLVLLPALGLSIVATWLTTHGGIGPSLAYIAVVRGFMELSPSVPDLTWTWSALLGLAIPMLAMPLIRHIYSYVDPTTSVLERPSEVTRFPAWLAPSSTIIALVVMVGFGTGVFGVKPYVVSGTSMQPTYRAGDVVLIGAVDPELLNVGDVVRFDLHEFSVMHRIVEIAASGGTQSIVTQGDRNSRPDPPLSPDEVDGRVVFAIPGPQTIVAWLRGEL